MVAPWLFGLALGALHPIGLLLAITGLAVFLCFAAPTGYAVLAPIEKLGASPRQDAGCALDA